MCQVCDQMTTSILASIVEYWQYMRSLSVAELNERYGWLTGVTDPVAAEVRMDILNELHSRALSE
jgi:hypothetical protein